MPVLSLDWTTLMFFLASLSDKGVCALVDHEAEKAKLWSGLKRPKLIHATGKLFASYLRKFNKLDRPSTRGTNHNILPFR